MRTPSPTSPATEPPHPAGEVAQHAQQAGQVRMTQATLDVLEILTETTEPVYGRVIINKTNRPGGTIYPILARLERVGWVSSRWADDDDGRARGPRRRYYLMSPEGRKQAKQALLNRAAPQENAPPGKFAQQLRELRAAAGNPSLRELASQTFYSPGAISEAFAGRVIPSAPITRAIVYALEGDITEWEERRESALREQQAASIKTFGFREFYIQAWSSVRWLGHNISMPNEDLEDVFQDIMVDAIRQWDALRRRPDPRTWIYNVATRRLFRERDLQASRLALFEESLENDEDENLCGASHTHLEVAAQEPDIADDVASKLYVDEFIKQAPTRQLELALMQHAVGYSMKEIADNLGFNSSEELAHKLRLFGQSLTNSDDLPQT